MLFLALLMSLVSSRYLSLNPALYFPQQRMVYQAHTPALLLHIVGAMLAVLIGPVQFLLTARGVNNVFLHRLLGRVYLCGVLLAGLAGLYLSGFAFGGLVARAGFATLAVLWLSSGYLAYLSIRRGQVERHRAWMTRNYALTFAAVTLRLWQVGFGLSGVEFELGYRVVAWLCWIPNLAVAEGLIARGRVVQVGE